MKIKQLKYIGLLSIAIAFNSCNDIDLNSTPYDSVAVVDGISNVGSATASVDGMYDLLYRVSYYGRDMFVIPDVSADNILVAPSNSGRFLREYQYSVLPTDGAVGSIWNNMYKNINAANTVLNFSANASDATPEQLNEINGHAYAIRGMAHFDLVRSYAFPYNTTDASVAPGANGAGGHLGVPLLVEYGQERYAPRATVAQVYDQVIADLNMAKSLLPAASYAKNSKYNKSAIDALLSRVYLYKADYPNAYAAGVRVMNSGMYSLVNSGNFASNWDGSMESGVILQLPSSANDNNGFNALGSIYVDNGDDGNGGYGDLIPTTDITSMYASSDARNAWFRNVGGIAFNFKFPRSWTNDIPVIRLAEVYLNIAEAAAMGGGSTATGASALNMVRQAADPTAATAGLTIAAVKDERRKELAFEGQRRYDLVRWQEDIVRGQTASPSTISTITYPDYRMVFPIPQSEIDANNNINENNVGY